MTDVTATQMHAIEAVSLLNRAEKLTYGDRSGDQLSVLQGIGAGIEAMTYAVLSLRPGATDELGGSDGVDAQHYVDRAESAERRVTQLETQLRDTTAKLAEMVVTADTARRSERKVADQLGAVQVAVADSRSDPERVHRVRRALGEDVGELAAWESRLMARLPLFPLTEIRQAVAILTTTVEDDEARQQALASLRGES